MAFEKISDTDLVNKGVTGLPDVPGLSTSEMQAKFDELSKEVVIPKINDIIDGLNGDEVSKSSKVENPITKEKDIIQNVVNAIYNIVNQNSEARHGHANKNTLDAITEELYNSINTLVYMLRGITDITKTVTADDTKLPTSKAIVDYVLGLTLGYQVISNKTDLMSLNKSGYLVDALAVKNKFDEVDSNLENHKQSNATTLVTISTDGSYSLNEDYDHYKTILVQTFLEGYLLTDFTIPSTLLKQRNKQGNDLVLTYNDGTIRKAQIYFPTTKTCTTRLMSNVTTLKVYGIDKI